MPDGPLLAIESSTRGGVALAIDGRIRALDLPPATRPRASEILPHIAQLLNDAGLQPRDIRALAYSAGPGSFTGLRIATSIASAWQSALGIAVVAVPTIEVVARNLLQVAPPPARAVVLLESKPGFAYAALAHVEHDIVRVESPALIRPEIWLAALPPPLLVLGEGLRHQRAVCEQLGFTVLPSELWAPRAAELAVLGRQCWASNQLCAPQDIRPLYIRPPECEEVYEQRRADARARRGE